LLPVLIGGLAVPGMAATAGTTGGPSGPGGPSSNLIADGNAEAGYCTNDWVAATTIPGWTITHGSPGVMCYGAGEFSLPGAGGRAFMAPGVQGDSAITQTTDVTSAAHAIDSGSVRFNLSGWLGGWTTYPGHVTVTATFLDRRDRQVGTTASLPAVTAADRNNQTKFLARSATGHVPAETRSIRVSVQFLDTAAKGYSGRPGSAGYADNLSLTLSTPVAPPRLAPPPSEVPKFDHVFMIMMENTDYASIMADTTGMPYFHSLLAKGAPLSNYYAVYHPSDENYTAISGGDTYAQGGTYWPDFNDPNRNIADELEAQGKTWKSYEQGMGTPCNADPSSWAATQAYDKYYYPDDAPFINYTDISGNAARCRAHLFDTTQLATDLKRARTTPAFSWVAPDDYYDGEASGNGNAQSRHVQDGWLQQTINPILASPAWRNQRSLLIVNWDEAYNPSTGYPPGNQVAAVVLGSHGTVPAGVTSAIRYDHYSTGRTIENALGLAPFTADDRYATPFDVFRRGH
jgi:hypothetical protein